MYTRKLKTRVFIRKNADDALQQLFEAKQRHIETLDRRLFECQMRADNLYMELHQIPHGRLYLKQQPLPLGETA